MKKQTMLIVTVRASDAVEGCGGVIAKYAAEGHHVELIVLSDAEGAKREPLLREVLKGLGVSALEFADRPGMPLEWSDEDCEWLACRFRSIRPDFIVTHAKEPDLRSPDRGYASAAVMKSYFIASAAGAPCEGLPVSPRQTPMVGLEPTHSEEIGWVPGVLIDVTPFLDQKMTAFDRLFPGDEHRRERCMEQMKNRAVHCSGRGGVTGCKFAEAFSSFGPIYAHGHFVW